MLYLDMVTILVFGRKSQGGSGVYDVPLLCGEFEASLVSMRPCLKESKGPEEMAQQVK